jgi:hypothetical protein
MPGSTALMLQHWAGLGAGLRESASRPEQPTPRSFEASFAGLIRSAKVLRQLDELMLDEVIEQTRAQLDPLGEPLEQDFGLNRWLAGAREEAYSDWLLWLFARMTIGDLAGVLDVPELRDLGIDSPVLGEREIWIGQGSSENSAGRLDILMRLLDRVLLIVEVKKEDIGDLGVQQLIRYRNMLLADPYLSRYRQIYILLSPIVLADVDGIKIRDYSKFCRNIRRLAMRWTATKKRLEAAAALMVTGAIEANLLGMSAKRTSFTPLTIDHLRRFAASGEYECWENQND